MVSIVTTPENTRCVFHELVYTLRGLRMLRNPRTPPQWLFYPSIYKCVQDIARDWRHEHPDRIIRLEKVEIHVASDEMPVMMLLEAIGVVEHIAIWTRQALSGEAAWSILNKYSKLKKLTIVNIRMETMNQIANLADSQLEEVELIDVALEATSSFVDFIRLIGDKSTNLAKNLRRLVVYRRDDSGDKYALDEDAARALLKMLASNRVLASISTTLADEPEAMLDSRNELIEQNDMIIVKGQPSEEEDQRLPPRRLAFLSVIRDGVSACRQLDAMVLRNIFEFMMAFEYRIIGVSFESPDIDFDDDFFESLTCFRD